MGHDLFREIDSYKVAASKVLDFSGLMLHKKMKAKPMKVEMRVAEWVKGEV